MPSDLTQFFSNLGISAPKVTAVSVDGAKNSPTGDASGPDGEVELDIEVAGAIAPAAQIAAIFRAKYGSRIHRRNHDGRA